jgi:hypothetical protein
VAFGNYRMQAGSPVFAAGTSLPIEQSDLYGNPRPVTGRFDIGANEFKDSLGSGMQDDWEIKHGLSTTVSEASLDPDGDGVNNLQEYKQNTDPHNPDTAGDGISDGPLVPPGSGLLPGPSPDPTTPDLVLYTVFFDGYFESWFELYVDNVPQPQWINLPPTSPRPVILTDNHIGDHVNFQWKLLGSTGFDPGYLVFYVPHTTLGSIIPDTNAVPLNQIDFGFGNLAPPDGPWGFTIAETTPLNDDACAGFDSETPQFFPWLPPAVSVPQGGTNTFTVNITPPNVIGQILFQMTNTLSASVSPSSAGSTTQLVSIAGLATGGAATNQFQVLGYGAQNTFTTTCARVTVDIFPKNTNVTVAIWAITATGEPSTTPTNAPTQAQLKSYLDSVYGKQANVFMNVLPLVSTNVNYDLNGNGQLDIDPFGLSPEQSAITNVAHVSGAFNVYYVHALTTNLNALGIAYPQPGLAFIGDSHPPSTGTISGHEIGHLFGFPDVDYIHQWGLADRLMWYQAQVGIDPCRLVEVEWRAANAFRP